MHGTPRCSRGVSTFTMIVRESDATVVAELCHHQLAEHQAGRDPARWPPAVGTQRNRVVAVVIVRNHAVVSLPPTIGNSMQALPME